MFPRIREIRDVLGPCLRISVEPHPSGALITLERRDQPSRPRASLDGYGVDILAGYVMSARLAPAGDLPEERVGGRFPSCLQLRHGSGAAIVVSQADMASPVLIPATIWDRLFAELCLVAAHAREFGRGKEIRLQ